MRDRNVFGIKRALPRMSWSPQNLYNLYRRSLTELKDETVFTYSGNSLFQQRWESKQLTRAYHGDFINEKIFKRWYLPSTLPDVRPRTSRIASSASAAASSSSSLGTNTRQTRKGLAGVGVMDDVQALMKWASRSKDAQREQNLKEEEDLLAQAPVASLMYEEVERRIDVFIFRCCFAHSVYDARRMVIHGWVKLNGRKHTNANTRIAPGDMVSVDPEAINFLQKPREPEEKPASESPESSTEEGANAEAPKDSSTPTREAIQYFRESNKDELTPFNLPPYSAPFIFIPAYIEVNFLTCSAVFVRRPTARYNYSEIPSPYEADGEIMRLSWEWYNKVRPRMRSKSQLARMPENRKEVRVIPGVSAHPAKMSTTVLV